MGPDRVVLVNEYNNISHHEDRTPCRQSVHHRNWNLKASTLRVLARMVAEPPKAALLTAVLQTMLLPP